MQQSLLVLGRSLCRYVLIIALVLLINVSTVFFVQPSYAANTASTSVSPDEQVDRAYKFRQGVGVEEEVYQQRLQEGQDPEQMPKPYKRVPSFKDKQEVPETSLLETTVSKTRELVDNVKK